MLGEGSGKGGRSAFTLIELLVVIAILGVLATAVVLVINPAELLKQGRDATRLSDLAALSSALSLFTTDQWSQSLGSSTVTYLSLPEPTTAITDCSDLGFPAGYFHCAASSTYTKTDGTGWIPVNLQSISSGSPLSKLPVDPINSTSSHLYYAYWSNGTSYKLTAFPESQKYLAQAAQNGQMFQAGSNMNLAGGPNWVLVPGNSQFGTQNFWVMQYDAGCSDGNGNYLNDYNSGYSTYSDSSYTCTANHGRQIADLVGAWPIANITHTTALSYCASIGAHLLTNDEYMTIVTDAANQGTNWSNGSVGSGVMPRGNSDSSAAQPDGVGQYGTGYSDFTHLRTMTLSDGSVVWDMAGNVWQHVQRSSMNSGDNTATITTPTCSSGTPGTWEWCQYGNSLTPYVTAYNDSTFSASTVGPPNSSWNSNQNIGQVQTNDGSTGGQVFLRGGSWGSGSDDGPFTLYLSWGPSDTGNTVGFRCAR